MTIQVIPHQIHGYDSEDMLIFTLTKTSPTVCHVELKNGHHHTLESWRELSAAIEKAFQMFKEADKP